MGLCRDINELTPGMQIKCQAFLAKCEAAGMPVAINETRRSAEVQTAYYAQGRQPLNEVNELRDTADLWPITAAENKRTITNSDKLGPHGRGEAFDACPLDGYGRMWWKAPAELWEAMGKIGESVGLDWGGRWKSWDCPHFEEQADA